MITLRDLVTDFNVNGGDRIRIGSDVDTNINMEEIQSFKFTGTAASSYALWTEQPATDETGIWLVGNTDGATDTHEFSVFLSGAGTLNTKSLTLQELA